MIRVDPPVTTIPKHFETPLEERVYAALRELEIPFLRVDNEPALTMADCEAIDLALDVKVVKTLLLCDRRARSFYLYVMPGDVPFRASAFGAGLGVSRVSFAAEEKLWELLGTRVGATTVFSCLLPSSRDVRLVFDRRVLVDPWYGCTDGTTTCYMKLRTEDLLKKLLPYCQRNYEVIEL